MEENVVNDDKKRTEPVAAERSEPEPEAIGSVNQPEARAEVLAEQPAQRAVEETLAAVQALIEKPIVPEVVQAEAQQMLAPEVVAAESLKEQEVTTYAPAQPTLESQPEATVLETVGAELPVVEAPLEVAEPPIVTAESVLAEPMPIHEPATELPSQPEVTTEPEAPAELPTEQPETPLAAEAFLPEQLIPQPEVVPTTEDPYVFQGEPEAALETFMSTEAVVEHIAPKAPTESTIAVPEANPELVLAPETPPVTDSLEQFELFVAQLHDIEAPAEKLAVVHEKVEKITELTMLIRESKLLDEGAGVEAIEEELVETFLGLFEATGMRLSEESVRHMVHLWVARDVLDGKDFEIAKSELFEDKGMREVLQQFMHGIAKLKELLESIHVRLGKLVLSSTPPHNLAQAL